MGEWRKLHNEELHNSYSSSNIIRQMKSRRMRWTDVEEGRKLYKVVIGKPEGKSRFGRPRRRWEDGFGMDRREIGWWMTIGYHWLRIGTGGELL
jgi:hypothetical protein